ncbi:hypothetical protein WKW50_25565 [Ochrobactrum sp. GPK 3]
MISPTGLNLPLCSAVQLIIAVAIDINACSKGGDTIITVGETRSAAAEVVIFHWIQCELKSREIRDATVVGKVCLKQMTVVAATCPESLQGDGSCARLGRYTEIILFNGPICHLRKVEETTRKNISCS